MNIVYIVIRAVAVIIGLLLGAGLAALTVFVLWVAIIGEMGGNPFQ